VAQIDPTKLSEVTGNLAHYMPDHASAAGETIGRVVSYLNSIKPPTGRQSPLDPPRKPNSFEKASYKNALQIAQQPLIILQKMKDGTLTMKDMEAGHSMYPELMEGFRAKLMAKIVDVEHADIAIPYKTRLSLSLFMGQPLESSIMPQNIMASQSPPPVSNKGPQSTGGPSQASINGLKDSVQASQTPQQARSANRQLPV
jgi:hypothetical protein